MKIHVLKDNERLGLIKNSIVFVDNNIGVKAIESGCAKLYIDKIKEKPRKKSKE